LSGETGRRDTVAIARLVALGAVAAAAVGVLVTWTDDGTIALQGVQGPNNGWLVLIVAGFAAAWIPSMTRGSWVGVIGVLGAAAVMAWTAIESWLDAREVLDASAGVGILLVVGASVVLGAAAAAAAAALVLQRRRA
jgi:hypothetical protein